VVLGNGLRFRGENLAARCRASAVQEQ
jgi:hypothetical protein